MKTISLKELFSFSEGARLYKQNALFAKKNREIEKEARRNWKRNKRKFQFTKILAYHFRQQRIEKMQKHPKFKDIQAAALAGKIW